MQTTSLKHLLSKWHPKPYHSFGHARRCSGEERGSDPPPESHSIGPVGNLPFHAVTIKHASIGLEATAHCFSPLGTLNKGRLQTRYKL